MRLLRGLQARSPQDTVVVMGNFDGMHGGHRQLLQQVKQISAIQHIVSTVIIFEPQPKEYFNPDDAPARLMRCRDKLAVLAAEGIDQVVLLAFNTQLSQLSATDFLERFLLGQLRMQHMVVGGDFCFGRDRQGTVAWLQSMASELGFGLNRLEDCQYQGQRMSSSVVRQALTAHDLATVQACLGRLFSITGKVSLGQRLGRRLGYPTLNVRLHRITPPLLGIYAVTVQGLPGGVVYGVASCGYRPVVHGQVCLLEVYCFDFDVQVYGCRVEVMFHHFIRDECDFPSLSSLQSQMKLDVVAAQHYFEQGEV